MFLVLTGSRSTAQASLGDSHRKAAEMPGFRFSGLEENDHLTSSYHITSVYRHIVVDRSVLRSVSYSAK